MIDAPETLRDLCKETGLRERLKEVGIWNIEGVLDEIERDPPKDLSLKSLYSYTANSSRHLVTLLSVLPPQKVRSYFGDEALAWSLLSQASPRDDLNEAIELLTGKNAVLEKTLFFRWCRFADKNIGDVIRMYDLLHRAKYEDKGIDVSQLIDKCGKIPPERISAYGIEPMSTEGHVNNGRAQNWFGRKENSLEYNIRIDMPLAFGLMYKGKPSAVIAFNIENPETVMIYQLQGVRPRIINGNIMSGKKSTHGLSPLDWEKLMVDIVAKWAKDADFSELAVCSGRFNPWAGPDGGKETHLGFEQAWKRYDGTAQRLGFKKKDDGNWYKPLSEFQ